MLFLRVFVYSIHFLCDSNIIYIFYEHLCCIGLPSVNLPYDMDSVSLILFLFFTVCVCVFGSSLWLLSSFGPITSKRTSIQPYEYNTYTLHVLKIAWNDFPQLSVHSHLLFRYIRYCFSATNGDSYSETTYTQLTIQSLMIAHAHLSWLYDSHFSPPFLL